MRDQTVTTLKPRGALQIPTDPTEAAAAVLACIKQGHTGTVEKAEALDAMTSRVKSLLNLDRQQMLSELAGHAAILDALFQRFAVEATQAHSFEVRARFAKLALHSQAAYARTLGTIETLRQVRQAKQPVAVTVDHGDTEEGD